jgi:LytR cell envelope-related transcriptional attenuator
VTSPDGSKGSSPLRVGGLALLGVGVVAGILGVVGLNSGGGTPPPVAAPSLSTAAAPSESAEAAAPTSAPVETAPPETAPPAAPAPAPASPAPPAAAAPAPPAADGSGAARSGAGAGSAAGSAAGPSDGARMAVRVYNNSTIGGLAAHAADDFRGAGWTVDAVANYPSSEGIIPTSTVYFRPGTGEQGSAERIGNEFGLRAAPRFAGLTDASPGLIVIVTNDYQKR